MASNRTENFNPIKGWKMTKLPMIASVEMEQNAVIYRVEDGTYTICTNATGNFAGILAEEITSSDDDYATSMKMKKVYVPVNSFATAEFTVGAGTFTTADVGKSVKFNDSTGLAVDTAGTQAVITKYKSSTKGECMFNYVIS